MTELRFRHCSIIGLSLEEIRDRIIEKGYEAELVGWGVIQIETSATFAELKVIFKLPTYSLSFYK